MGRNKTEGYRCDEAAQQRAAENIRLVYHMVQVFKRKTGMPYLAQDEAEGIGMVALVRAAASPKYDPKRGAFSTYACQGIWLALCTASDSQRRKLRGAFVRTNTDHDGKDLFDTLPGRPDEPIRETTLTDWLKEKVRPTINEDKLPIFDLWLEGHGPFEIAQKLGKPRSTVNAYVSFQRDRIRKKFKPDPNRFM